MRSAPLLTLLMVGCAYEPAPEEPAEDAKEQTESADPEAQEPAAPVAQNKCTERFRSLRPAVLPVPNYDNNPQVTGAEYLQQFYDYCGGATPDFVCYRESDHTYLVRYSNAHPDWPNGVSGDAYLAWAYERSYWQAGFGEAMDEIERDCPEYEQGQNDMEWLTEVSE